MLLRSLVRLASVLLASAATTAPVTIAASSLATPAAAQEVATLNISDLSKVSTAELEAAVTAYVQQLRAAGYTDLEIVQMLGEQLKQISATLPTAQQRALMINVVAILSTLAPTISVAELQTQFIKGYGEISGPVFVAQGDLPSPKPTY